MKGYIKVINTRYEKEEVYVNVNQIKMLKQFGKKIFIYLDEQFSVHVEMTMEELAQNILMQEQKKARVSLSAI